MHVNLLRVEINIVKPRICKILLNDTLDLYLHRRRKRGGGGGGGGGRGGQAPQ